MAGPAKFGGKLAFHSGHLTLHRKDWSDVPVSPVIIADKVWIGMGAMILPGRIIGEGAVVGAGSVVTRNVEPWTVVAGNPARVIRQILPGARRAPESLP